MSDSDATENKPARKPRKTAAKKSARKKVAAPQAPATKAESGLAVSEPTQPHPSMPQPTQSQQPPGPKLAPSKSRRSKPRPARAPQALQEPKRQEQAAPRSGSAPSADSPPPARAIPTALIRVPMPVRWRDLDAFNHVNNSKYLSYLEEARLQWMLTVPGMGMDDHVAPVVAAAQLNYRRPITWPSQVEIELFVERLGNTSLTVGHRIIDSADNGVLFCDGHVVMVWIDRDSGGAAALPEGVREACKG